MNLKLIIVFVFLVPFALAAQDCKTTVYLESQTVKDGELVTIVAGVVNLQPGKQFVVENGGHVVLQAAGRIELNNGFKALSGSGLMADVEACDPNDPGPEPSVVYPNPTDGILNIKASYKISAVRVTDMSGLKQFEKTGIDDSAFSFDISHLKQGYYILEIIVGKDVTESIRIEKK